MSPLFLREAGHAQDNGEDFVEMVVELFQRLVQHIRRGGAEQVVDLVVRQAAPKETELNLGVVDLLEVLAHLLQRSKFLLHKLGRVRR